MRYAGEFAALGTAVCWAAGSNLFAAAGQRLGSAVLNRLRISVAALLLGTALFALRGSPWPTWASPAQVGLLAASGLIGFVFGDTYYFRSLVILGPGRAALLASLAPLFTVAIAWPLLGELPGPLALLGMALTLGGIFWVLWTHEQQAHRHVEGSARAGVVAGVLAAVGQAAGYVLSKLALRGGLDPLSATVIRIAAAVVGVWALALVQREALRSLGALRDRRGALFMVGGAVAGPFLGVTLSLTALQYVQAGVAASLTAIYPVLTLLLAARFHGERLTLRTLAGTAVAVAGVVVLFLR
jgi:drug/metabolite transporter (DMT)-like permease